METKFKGEMKKILIIAIVLLSSSLYGQDESEGVGSSGIMGYLQVGAAFRLPNDFGAEMNAILNERENYSQTGTVIGAGAFYRFKNGIIGGINGFGIFYPKVSGGRSVVEIAGVGINFHGGYIIMDNGRWMIYPYLGVGGFRSTVAIDNLGSLVNQSLLFIAPGGSDELNSELVYLDIGATIWRGLTPVGSRIFAIGLSAGFKQSIFGTVWETSEGYNLDNLSDPLLSAFYVKVSIGGGGFK